MVRVNLSSLSSIVSISLIRVLLMILSSFVFIGESTKGLVINIFRYIRAHIIAGFYALRYFAKYISKQIGRFIDTICKIKSILWLSLSKYIRISTSYIGRLLKKVNISIRWVIRLGRKVLSYIFLQIVNGLKRIRHVLNLKPIRLTSQSKTNSHIRNKYWLLKLSSVFTLLLFFILATYSIYNFYVNLPRPKDIGKINYALTTHVYDKNDKSLFDFYKDQHRTPITLTELPQYVMQATIAIEDKNFYSHKGISLFNGIARAIRENILRRGKLQGGSTITQQLVKTALLSSERTFTRKIKEIIIALETEQVYTKDEILTMYLNQVPYGGSTYGIEEASKRFFNKSARSLTLSEAALLAGLPQAPTTYSPFNNISNAISRRNQVLQEMLDQQYISNKQYDQAVNEQLKIASDSISIQAPHFVFYVKNYLQNYFDTNQIYQGGYSVKTTLDLDVQKKVEAILQEELTKISYLNVSNGAILVTNPKTGEILAMVGSVNFFDGKSGEFNVTTGLRQPGSSIKPIMYAYALEKGYTSATIIDDSPTVFQSGGYEAYRPVNYDGRFHGSVTLRNALANSYNIPAVKTLNRIGVVDFINFANSAGIDTWEDPSNYGLSLALGGGDVTMVDMAEAYGMLANGGERIDITPVSEIKTKNNKILQKDQPYKEQVIDNSYTYIISDILSDNQARASAFGSGSTLEIPGYKVAVKTGTTDEKRDNWTIGYTPDYLVVVWVGNNDHSPMNPYLTSGITGAAPIWNRVMTYLLTEKGNGQKNWYTKPDNVIAKSCYGKTEYFVAGTENSVPCSMPKKPANVATKPTP